eukprot:TRINITY_DN2698_c0_g1_i6.p1 TRINITY_DN2698_c0_g1~~TRINITY_DN2698_c0_g1_i6.p1  ORF type:complete len:399 (-),score=71.65 TRINITY_DN2698_c0_g1_i6:177-1373(-)
MNGDEGLALSSIGTLWYVHFSEEVTIRLANSHVDGSITEARALLTDDEALRLLTSSTDSSLKEWDLTTLEQKSELMVPLKACLCLDVLPTALKVVGGFADGGLRFFDPRSMSHLGSCFLTSPDEQPQPRGYSSFGAREKPHAITSVKFLPSGKNVIAGNTKGDVYMVHVETWEKSLRVDMARFIKDVGFAIHEVQVYPHDPTYLFGLTTKRGKLMVWNRKNLMRRPNDPGEDVIARVGELEYYLVDSYSLSRFADLAPAEADGDRSLRGKNLFDTGDDALLRFTNNLKDTYACAITRQPFVVVRNFVEHTNLRKIELETLPTALLLSPNDMLLLVGTKDGRLRILEFDSGIDRDTITVDSHPITSLTSVAVPNPRSKNAGAMVVATVDNGIYVYLGKI